MNLTELLSEILPRLGHRNWIAVVDSAYPEQVSPGIQIHVIPEVPHNDAVREVLSAISAYGHVRPDVFLDEELDFLPEAHAPGIAHVRESIHAAVESFKLQKLPHAEIIAMMATAASSFSVLVLKTNMKLPYTSVFMRLECGYWTEDAEVRLREKVKEKHDD